MKLRDAAVQLSEAITRAVREHGAPNSFSLGELHAHYGGPLPTLSGRATVFVCREWLALAGVSFAPSGRVLVRGKEERAKDADMALLDELPFPCAHCAKTAYVTAGERMGGSWTCYRCGLVNRFERKGSP